MKKEYHDGFLFDLNSLSDNLRLMDYFLVSYNRRLFNILDFCDFSVLSDNFLLELFYHLSEEPSSNFKHSNLFFIQNEIRSFNELVNVNYFVDPSLHINVLYFFDGLVSIDDLFNQSFSGNENWSIYVLIDENSLFYLNFNVFIDPNDFVFPLIDVLIYVDVFGDDLFKEFVYVNQFLYLVIHKFVNENYFVNWFVDPLFLI